MTVYTIRSAADINTKIPAAKRERFFADLAATAQLEGDGVERRELRRLAAHAFYGKALKAPAGSAAPRVMLEWRDDGGATARKG